MRLSSFVISCLLVVGLAGVAWSHGVPIDISATPKGLLTTDHGVYESDLNLVAGTVLTTTLPGFGVKTPDQGIAADTELELAVLGPMLFWDGAGVAPTTASLLLENPAGDASYTVTGDLGVQTGMVWGTYSGEDGWHAHGDYTLEPVSAETGAYGLVLQLRATGYQNSPPFLIALNNGLEESVFTTGVDALAALVPEPGTGVLALFGVLSLSAWRRRRRQCGG